MKTRILSLAVAVLFILINAAHGADVFVNKAGSDTNDGASATSAFLTIQKGVDALQPGDTLTIGPGEYHENVTRENLGGAEAETVIRAEIPRTVLLRGYVSAPEFKKVEGYRFVYACDFDQTPTAVVESETRKVLVKRPNMRDVEYEPGTFYHNEETKTLYISTSDLREIGRRHYAATINGENGIELTKPQKVVIEGLAVGGFYPGYGILLNEPVGCTVRDCVTFMGEGGICLDYGSDNIVENCESYANTFGGIVRYRANNDIIRNCLTYDNVREGHEHFGIIHYFDMPGSLLIQDNVSWGQIFDYSVKPSQNERLERSVALGPVRNGKMFHNIIAGGNEYDRTLSAPAGNILFLREEDMDKDFDFADHLNLDFRLQLDSRFRGTAPDGSDRGPHQYEPVVFYVSSNGDDANDGLSMRTPWRTLKRALQDIHPGNTLYLAEGKYDAALSENLGDGKLPINIRGRGRGDVVITGVQNVDDCAGIVFERLNFSGGMELNNSRNIAFRNCAFYGAADGLQAQNVRGLTITHSVFHDALLSMAGCDGGMLTGNVYSGDAMVRIGPNVNVRYSDYNSYQRPAQCWAVNGAAWSLLDLQERHDKYSKALTPEWRMDDGVPHLANADEFEGRGPHIKALGVHHEYDAAPVELKLVGPFLHSVSDTTANIEWWTSRPATYELAWGDTPEMKNTVKNLKAPDCYTTYSLTGLKPGATYHFEIRSADTAVRDQRLSATALKTAVPPISFTTMAVAPKPAIYYVAEDGNDVNSGLTRADAWRTVSHAADVVNAGDTVMIAGGDYREDLRIRATGDEGKPITFKCIPGEKVFFHGDNLSQAFKIIVKKHLRFDGFYFVDFGDSMEAIFVLWDGDDVSITRCFNVKGNGNISLIIADYCANLLVKNCVTANGFGSTQLHVSPDFRLENNVLLRPYIAALYFVNEPEQKGYFSRNIVTDNLPTKVGVPLMDVGRFESFVEADNCYFLRVSDEERKMLRFFGTAAYERYAPSYGVTTDYKTPPVFVDHPDGTENNPTFSLAGYQEMVGDTGSYVSDPKFAGAAEMEQRGGLMIDRILGKQDLDFDDLFATDPKAVEKGIGLVPEDFADFKFEE